METYKMTHPDLKDCDATIEFLKITNKLITAMTSRSIKNSLSKNNDSNNNYCFIKAIVDYIDFLKGWKKDAQERGYVFMSSNTYLGFLVTLKSTLEIMEYLTEKCGFEFLMTSRLNQDTLEVRSFVVF